jgi:hypothetical protein
MARTTWVYDPQSGGRTIPDSIKPRVCKRIQDYAEKHYAGKYARIDVRFHGKFCYIDAYTEPDEPEDSLLKMTGETREEYFKRMCSWPLHLCRLRYFGDENRWSMAFYTYSHEKYEPCIFDNGSWEGTPEEGFATSAVYLHD